MLIFFVVVACKKENSKKWTEVKITATNYVTGEPISDIYCGVLTVDDGFLLNDKNVTLDEKWMENGIYQFGFKAKKNKNYWAEASIDILKYYPISFSNYMNIDNSELNEFNFELVKPGFLNLNISNVNCENSNDQLRFRYYSKKNISDPDYIFIYSAYWDGELYLDGCINMIGQGGHQKLPAGYYTIEWNVQRDSGYSSGTDTFFVSEDDTTTYLLEY